MESLVHNYTFDNEISEVLLERRLSPYATLRGVDLAALLRLQTTLSSPLSTSFSRNHDSSDIKVRDIVCCNNKTLPSLDLEDVFEGPENESFEDDVPSDDRRQPCAVEVVCRGADTNDCPAEYTVKGLRHHEMPVMGVCVDKRICPGFQYNVRRADSERLMFKTPRTLLSIGMGYGKRITFLGDSLNDNDCFFWSDSEPNGYALSIHAISIGQRFSILDPHNMIIGEAVVENIPEPQVEISSVVKDRTVVKHVSVTVNCSMKYYQRHHHGLMEMMVHEDSEVVTGIVVLTKSKSNKQAQLECVKDIFLERFGLCKFELDV